MAQNFDPKKALQKNRVKIVNGLQNGDAVADYLFGCGLFTAEMREIIEEEKEIQKKNRKILETLHYRGKGAVKGLYEAFLETDNKELAELLADYVKVLERDENRFSPSIWPPAMEDQKRMESESIRRIKYAKDPLVAFKYTNDKEVYKMRNKNRGIVFMINNVNFVKMRNPYLSDREGSDYDAKNLKDLFVELQFEVIDRKNLPGKEMLEFLEEESKKVNWYEMECVILIIMSHGETTGIYGTDCVSIDLKKFTDILKNCPGLNEKPKLVFVQACRGTQTETGHAEGQGGIQATDGTEVIEGVEQLSLEDVTDAVKDNEGSPTEIKTVHSEADFLIAYATPEGTPAYRHIEIGSWFLNAVVWVFKYHADQEEIQHLLVKVNELVSKGRTSRGHLTVSESSSKLRKKFYFFPGVYDDPPKLLEQ